MTSTTQYGTGQTLFGPSRTVSLATVSDLYEPEARFLADAAAIEFMDELATEWPLPDHEDNE